MKKHGGITNEDAIIGFRCFRLSARIHDLRDEGYIIETEMVHNNGYFGQHGVYRLIKEPS